MHEPAAPPQTRRALRELERARVPRRRRALGHRDAPAARRSGPQPALSRLPLESAPSTPRPARQAASAPRPRRAHPLLTAAAFVFAASLAATSVVPMLALGQSASAAAATAVGVQTPDKVQAWRSSFTSTLPRASRDAYSAEIARPSSTVDAAVGAASGKIQWPFPSIPPISYGFGPRIAPMEGASTFHEGVDFDPGAGTPIQIIAAGTVKKVVSNPHDSLGVHVVVDHGIIGGHHIESWYCEMAPGSIKVRQGQQVSPGDIVGVVGMSGISTGAHLHFELHQDGTPVDPMAWLRAHVG